jgi:hypothetical protein
MNISQPEAGSIADKFGVFYPRVKYRITDVPELGYLSTDLPNPR